MTPEPEWVTEARTTDQESARIEFKESFDPSSTEDQCDLVKELVAIANSGGGIVLIGIDDEGGISDADLGPVRKYSPEKLTDLVHKYTGNQFSNFRINDFEWKKGEVVAVRVGPARLPMVFEKVGQYQDHQGEQKIAFRRGMVYFRHGAKSEPGSSQDIAESLGREIDRRRDLWLDGIHKVITADPDATVKIVPENLLREDTGEKVRVQLLDDDIDAPGYHQLDPDLSHPFRTTEVVQEVNKELGDGAINRRDIVAVKKAHNIPENPKFFYQSKWGSPRYSEQFVEWIVSSATEDEIFFERAREYYADSLQ